MSKKKKKKIYGEKAKMKQENDMQMKSVIRFRNKKG